MTRSEHSPAIVGRSGQALSGSNRREGHGYPKLVVVCDRAESSTLNEGVQSDKRAIVGSDRMVSENTANHICCVAVEHTWCAW